jgi:hypothetical protein
VFEYRIALDSAMSKSLDRIRHRRLTGMADS